MTDPSTVHRLGEIQREFCSDSAGGGVPKTKPPAIAETGGAEADAADAGLNGSQVTQLTAAERHKLLVEWNDTATDYPRDKCLHNLVEEQVARTPDAVAVVFAGQSLTYRELDQRANQLARHLQQLGVGPEKLVAICLERSLEMVVGLLGILKAGGAYVPVDPEYPADRVAFMLRDSNAPVLLTNQATRDRLAFSNAKIIRLDTDWCQIARANAATPKAAVKPENLAYVIYTSGSTGQPKGVMNTHAGIVNQITWMQNRFRLTAADRLLQKTPFSFDFSVWEFFWPLLAGARLVVAAPGGHRDNSYLLQVIRRESITALHFVPSMLWHFLREADVADGHALRLVFCGGEALTPDLQAMFFERLPGLPLHNLYGPTEAAVDVTHWECRPDSGLRSVPIGRPHANIQIYILNEAKHPVPVGIAGELHIGGIGLARGYLNRPELTAEKFIPHPFNKQPGARLYRTGDLARYLPDGNIEFLGRLDQQVKVRGFRVELGEIESVLGTHPAVSACAVKAKPDDRGDMSLEAFLVLRTPAALSAGELQAWLAKTLPGYMVPSVFTCVKELPLTPNGKLDRKALTNAGGSRLKTGTGYVAPRNELERQLCEIWQEVLAVERVGIHDNFFELGGHSLSAMQVITRGQHFLDERISAAALFAKPTIAQLASLLAKDTASESPDGKFVPAHSPVKTLSVHQLFEAQVDRTPGAESVILGGQSLTYRELDQRANQLAHRLMRLGVSSGALVGIGMERSPELIAAVMAVFKTGGTIVPIAPDLPPERIAFILRDARVSAMLVDSFMQTRLPPLETKVFLVDSVTDEITSRVPACEAQPEQAAFVIYTSGSTGQPKGVVVSQASYLNYRAAATAFFDINATDRVLHFAPFSFDAGLDQILTPLLAGATVVQYDGKFWDPKCLTRLIREYGLTVIHLPAACWAEWVESLCPKPDAHAFATLRLVQSGGDVMPVSAFKIWIGWELQNVRLVNRYGPTETTMFATAYEVYWDRPGDGLLEQVPIGLPVGPRTIHILDDQGAPVPTGMTGEIFIGGETLATGYLNRPELTAARFIPDPFSHHAGARLYKTGDLGRLRPDGNLDFIGRTDFQVKIRGYRIEPEEIEAVLRSHPAVKACAVMALPRGAMEKRLVAYIATREAGVLTSEPLRAWLRRQLPDYMVPAEFYELADLPLTYNGKTDRQALLTAKGNRLAAGNDLVAPQTETEKQLHRIWQELLHLKDFGINDNFFELGGHSLLAMRVVARINQALRANLSVRDFFETPTIAELAKLTLEFPGSQTTTPRENGASKPPLSFAQKRLWFLAEYEPESTAYHISNLWRLKGELRTDLLEQAFRELIQRHETLRTTFQMHDGSGVQVIAPVAQFSLPLLELTGQPDAEARARQHIAESLNTRFDLSAGPPIWAKLFRLNPQECLLLVNMHHIISDGWSLGVFSRELSAIYTALVSGEAIQLPPLIWQYADYTLWQQQWLQGPELERQTTYWRRQLAQAPTLDLPTDFVRPARLTYAGAKQPVSVSPVLSLRLASFNRAARVTPFMSLLAAFQVLLSRYSRQQDILVGTPIANRQRLETEGLIGFFVNTLVLRGDLAGNPSFSNFVQQVRTVALEAFEHQDLPFEELVKILNHDRDLSRSPVFQVLFVLQNAPECQLKLTGLETSAEPVATATTHFDLGLHLSQDGEGWSGYFEYNTDLFTPAFIERLAGHYLVLLDALLAKPDQPVAQAGMLTPAEHHQLLVEWNSTATDYPRNKCVHELFSIQAEQAPEATAVVYEGRQLTYRELDQQSNQLAWRLQALGVKPGSIVGLRLERSLELIAGLLGILKAGGTYWALEKDLPEERARLMLADAKPAVLLTHQADIPRLRALMEKALPGAGTVVAIENLCSGSAPAVSVPPVSATAAAYISFTSGSTGKSKAVLVPHRGVVRLVKNTHYATLNERETLLHLSSLSFDASTFEIWGALLNGARLVLMPCGMPTPVEIGAAIQRHGVTTLWLTAGLFHLMVDERLEDLRPLRQLLAGGDVLSPEKVRQVRQALPDIRMINGYGPTENTTFTCCHTVERDSDLSPSVPIGRPIANTQVYILDCHLQLVPIGVAGELFAGGDGVAIGYLNQPELSAERFVPNPFSNKPGSRLYRTGDLCRWRADGAIEFLGRLDDDQVKIRGFRVELGEVETALRRHPAVADAVVRAQTAGDGTRELAAWIVARPDQEPMLPNLRSDLAQWLPDYMIPHAFVMLEKLPLNPNGKVDRRALKASAGRRLTGLVAAAPCTDMEKKISLIWQELLRLERIGIHDNFFELGGHSLLAMRLVTEMQKQLGARITLAALFAAPTVAALAKLFKDIEPSAGLNPANHFRGSGSSVPLFYVPGINGYGFLPEAIAKMLGESGRFFDGFEFPGLHGTGAIPTSVEEVAASLIPQFEKVWPAGPCFLAGYSFGGTVAFELARQLQAKGRDVPFVLLLDSNIAKGTPKRRPLREILRNLRAQSASKGFFLLGSFIMRAAANKVRFVWKRKISGKIEPPASLGPMEQAMLRASQQYQPGMFSGKVTLVKVDEPPTFGFCYSYESDPLNGWGAVCRGGVEVIQVKGDHFSFLEEPTIHDLAEIMQRLLAQANEKNAAVQPS